MLCVYHGEDEFSRSQAIAQLRQQMDPVVGELNTTMLDGRSLKLSELRAACDTLPFLGDRRLVIVRDLVSPPAPARGTRREEAPVPADDGRLRELEAYLPQLPESTWLVLNEARSLPGGHPLLALAQGPRGQARHFPTPKGEELSRWINEQAASKGATIAGDAVALLARYIGPNLRLLDQELTKLATYVGEGGRIGRPEVERLVSSVQEASIFHLVDALGLRDRRRAVRLLHRLLEEGNAPLYILTMVTRQFRLLLQARELDAKGVPAAEMAREMEVRDWLVGKCLAQARNFRPADLRTILAQLLDIDVGIKTGRVDGALALDLFVVRWSGR